MNRADYIAGWKTADDWKSFRPILLSSQDRGLWEKTYEEYFMERLNRRYFDPIRTLLENDTFRGEGFSIVTIHCSVIEFLETTIQGLKYKYLKRGERLGKYEYSSSKAIFISFLTKRQPFNKCFNSGLAREFYESIRCGLLHEARTKNGWVIHAQSHNGHIIDEKQKVLFRNDLQHAFSEFLAWYRAELIGNPDCQSAFIRKFDSLCD